MNSVVEPWNDFAAGTEVSARRFSTWIYPCSCIPVPPEAFSTFAEVPPEPSVGDVLLVEVASVGRSTFVEDSYGCCIPIFPGTQLLAVAAPAHSCADLTSQPGNKLHLDSELELLNTGGTIGLVSRQEGSTERFTTVLLKSCFRDEGGNIVNTSEYGKQRWRPVVTKSKQSRKVIGVVNCAADRYLHDISGWSSATKALVYALASAGKTVTAGRVSGNAARRELRLLRAAGADHVADYVQLGYPTTRGLDNDTAALLFWQVYQTLLESSCEGGFVILEFGESLFNDRTSARLASKDVQGLLDRLVISGRQIEDLDKGVQLARGLNYKSILLASPAAGSASFKRKLSERELEFPCFDPLVVNIAYVSSLLNATQLEGEIELVQEKFQAVASQTPKLAEEIDS